MLPRSFFILCLPLCVGDWGAVCLAGAVKEAATEAVVPSKPFSAKGSKATLLPQHPSELYARLSEATRPQWRQHYRLTVTRCLDGRQQAAMGLGAVDADLFLAAQARDTQQIRNLLQDEETIEKTLGLIDPMTKLRNEVLGAAEQSDWVRLGAGIEKLTAGQRRYLREQKDEPLSDLLYIGQWLRTLQTCHAVVISRKLSDPGLAIGNPALITEMIRRLNMLTNPEDEPHRCLRTLQKRLAGLAKLWPEEGPSSIESPSRRLLRSAELLSDTLGELIQEEDPTPPSGTLGTLKPAPKS